MVPALLLWLAGLASLSSPAVLVQSQRTCEVHEKCVPLPDCKPLLRLVSHQGRKPSDEEKALLRASQCGWSPTSTYLPLVCCDLVPWGKCGDTAVHGQDLNGPALAGEFPWMARLVYRGAIDSADGAEHLSLDGCAASLISDRYLLTAARCVVGRDPPAYARLGDLGAGQDCGANANASECAAAFNAAVDDVIAHPEYVADTPGHEHDIALVKLKTGVRFSGAVAPVCLPIADPHAEAPRNDRPLTTLGWGSLHRANSNKTERLTKSVLKEVPHEFCAEKYKGTSDQVDGVHQMCARGAAEGSHACHGDPGAPLTSVAASKGAQRAILEGVASFGTAACASDGMPAVFSRVSTYLPWIMTNIRLA